MMRDPFAFNEELFEHRRTAEAALENAGFTYFGDYLSISLLHDEYGLEVSGIPEPGVATAIEKCLRTAFPEWTTPP